MYYAYSLLAGMLISVLVVFNGSLSAYLGQGLSLLAIHAVGLAAILLYMALRREKPRKSGLSLWWYTGGLLGILTTLFNLLAFGHISVSAMLGLSLLGESLSGLLADHTGFLGLPVRRFRAEKLLGAAITLAGILLMISDFVVIPVLLSLLAGVTVLLSRLINGRLARASSVATATFSNYAAGLLGSALLLPFLGLPEAIPRDIPFTAFLGGAVGTAVVLISNHIVRRISTFYMTLALFVGQVVAGLLLDMLLLGGFPLRTALGGLLVLLGLTASLLQDRARRRREPEPLRDAG